MSAVFILATFGLLATIVYTIAERYADPRDVWGDERRRR